MSKLKDKPLAQKLIDVKVVLTNIKQEDINSGFPEYGYDEVAISEGERLYEEVFQLIQKKEIADANYRKSTREMAEASDIAKKHYLKQVTLARIALRKTEISIKDLGIEGRRKQTFLGWTQEAKYFYTFAMKPEILTCLKKNGISLATLNTGLQMVLALNEKFAVKANLKGLAQVATMERNKKCTELYSWYMDFKKVAYLILGKNSQQLERFGFQVYSPGYKRRIKESADSNHLIPPDEIEPRDFNN